MRYNPSQERSCWQCSPTVPVHAGLVTQVRSHRLPTVPRAPRPAGDVHGEEGAREPLLVYCPMQHCPSSRVCSLLLSLDILETLSHREAPALCLLSIKVTSLWQSWGLLVSSSPPSLPIGTNGFHGLRPLPSSLQPPWSPPARPRCLPRPRRPRHLPTPHHVSCPPRECRRCRHTLPAPASAFLSQTSPLYQRPPHRQPVPPHACPQRRPPRQRPQL